ncbi:MAG: hypothetical protein ACPKM0_05000 [Pleomorphochaeta sp.]
MKKILAFLSIIFIFIQSILATNLAVISLSDASDDELAMMCEIRGLESNLSRSEMISQLEKLFIDEFGQASEELDIKTIENSLSFTIKNANTLKLINDNNSIIILEGNVELLFQEKDERNNTIYAQKVIIDKENTKLVALINVSYESDQSTIGSFSQEIYGDIISYDWDKEKLIVNSGSITTEKENSEGEAVTFYATSSTMNIDTVNSSLVLNDGFISTNQNTAYFSISAKKIAILNHGDMYFEDAKISLGRIDVLYLPYFYSPGATMLGNPAIGYESSRGAFVNTTFEIFGSYPNFSSTSSNSFNTFLESDENSNDYVDGPIYSESETEDDLELWAKKTSSYFALMLDSYENNPYAIEDEDNGSVALSYATELNLINNSLKIQSTAITSIASDGVDVIDDSSDYPIFRYDIDFKTTFDFENGEIEFYIPLISDPQVMKTYGNRLSTFSIDALWDTDQTFPTTYSSDISDYTMYLTGEYTYTPKTLNSIISEIKINEITVEVDYEWTSEDDVYSYYIDEVTLPDIDFDMSGTLIDISNENIVDNEKDNTSEEGKEDDGDDTSLLDNLYASTYSTNDEDIDPSSFSIEYDLDNDFSSTYDSDDNKDIYNQTTLDFDIEGNLEPDIIAIDSELEFEYIYDEEDDDSDYEIETSVDLETSNIISFEKINLNYYFDAILYEYEYTEDSDESSTEITEFEFSEDCITKHEIELIDTYEIYDLEISPSISLDLPPLDWALKPSILFEIDDFSNQTTLTFDISSSSFDFTEIDNELEFKIDNVSFDFDINYDVEESETSTRVIDPLELDTSIVYYNKDKNQYFSHTNKYYGLYDDSDNDYFSKFNFTYKNSYLMTKLNFYSEDDTLTLDYLKNTISFENLEKYWWKNRIGLNIDLDMTFNYSYSDIYSTYFSLETSISYRIAEFLQIDFNVETSNYSFYQYYDDDGVFSFSDMFSDLISSFDFINGGVYSTQFNLESISLDITHMMEDWDLHCTYEGSVVLSSYTYQWVPSVSVYLQWKALPELTVDQSFSNDGDGWE